MYANVFEIVSNFSVMIRTFYADHVRFYSSNGLPFVMGTAGGDRARMREVAQAAGVYAILPSAAGEQVRFRLQSVMKETVKWQGCS